MKINSIAKTLYTVPFILFAGFVLQNQVTDNRLVANHEFQQEKKSSQLDNKGIGPIKEVKLGSIDQRLVEKGSSIFNDKCALCHDIDNVNLAPPLRGITKRLSPEFIMNYLMNTTEMQKKDPYIKKLIQAWKTVPEMKDQRLKQSDARAVLEFLRSLEN